MVSGKFITLEGGEGAGKTTQLSRLAEALQAAGLAVECTREPGGSPGAEEIRELLVHGPAERWDPMTEALLHFAARHDHLQRRIRPALAEGRWVLCDRFADSTLAYQGYGHGLGPEVVQQLYGMVVGDFAPDLTIILDLPVDVGLRRAAARRGGGERYESMDRAFHERLRAGFQAIAGAEPDRCVVIDAEQPRERVQAALREAVQARLGITLP